MLTLEELRKLGKKTLPDSVSRPYYVNKIVSWLEKKEIIILKGIRRSGKTHIMYQLLKQLPDYNVFYFNFEDYLFEDQRNTDLLDAIIQLRDTKQKAYFFFDEIQQVQNFERWLRTWYDKELPIKFVIGGSNISLLTPHLATVLTGRNITFTVKPLSWAEAKEFTQISFAEYLEYGGFPEVVLEKNNDRKKEQLQQYLRDIIAKDVLFKHSGENAKLVESIVHFFLLNPGVKMSANKLGVQLHISKDTAQKYLEIVKDTFLLFEVPYFSWSMKTKYIGNRASKYYVVDNGFITAISLKRNYSALFENVVATFLHDAELLDTVYYWQNGVEIDFVFQNKAIQVTASEIIPKREHDAFIEFARKHKDFEHIVLTPSHSDISISLESFLEKGK